MDDKNGYFKLVITKTKMFVVSVKNEYSHDFCVVERYRGKLPSDLSECINKLDGYISLNYNGSNVYIAKDDIACIITFDRA